MSDLDNAINSINASAAKAENTATFLDDMSTFDDQSSVTNPNNGQTVASIPKQVKDRTDELFTAAESDINQAVSDAEQSAADAQDAADSIGRYQGLWPDTGGSADKGDTYQTQVSGTPTGQYFTALQDTTVDPIGDDVNWREVVSGQSLGRLVSYRADSVADAASGITTNGTVDLEIGQGWVVDDYYGGATPNNSGVLFFKVVQAGSGTDDGGKYIDVPGGLFQLEQNLKKPFSPESWGARGDGTSDDTLSINNCWSYASNGSVLHRSTAIYAISDSLNYLDGGTYDGNGCVIKPITGIDNNTNAFNPIDNVDETEKSSVIVKNFEIDGSRKGFHMAVRLFKTSHSSVRYNYIHDIGNIYGVDTLERGFGIVLEGASGSVVNSNDIVANKISNINGWGGIAGDFIYARYCDGTVISNNQCVGCQRMGVALTDYATNTTITGNTFSDIALAGIDLETNTKSGDLNKVVINSNTITRFAKKPSGQVGGQFFGIDLHDTATDITCNGNIITNADPDDVGNDSYAFVGINNALRVSITGNIVTNVDNLLKNYSGSSMREFTFNSNVVNVSEVGLDISVSAEFVIDGNFITSVGAPISVNSGFGIISDNVIKCSDKNAIYLGQSVDVNVNGNFLIAGSIDNPQGRNSTIYSRCTSSAVGVGVISGNTINGRNGAVRGIEFERQTGGTQRYVLKDNLFIEGITERVVNYTSESQADDGGVTVYSPSGTEYIIKVDDSGVISTSLA